MARIAHIVGARPQFIKFSAVSIALEMRSENQGKDQHILVHTGQHYDYEMSRIFFEELGIKEPEYHLGVGSGTHGEQLGKLLMSIEDYLHEDKPDAVVVYGDTNTTVAGALTAARHKIPVAHVESGLRSRDRGMPEEQNRVITDHLSTLLFAPCEQAVKSLVGEGIRNILYGGSLTPLDDLRDQLEGLTIEKLMNNPMAINVGDIMYDCLLHNLELLVDEERRLECLGVEPKAYCVLTIHREDTATNKEKLESIICFINEMTRGQRVVFPMHPRIKKAYSEADKRFEENVILMDAVGYLDMIALVKNARVLFTDSGGLQKEAYWLHVPCVTLRERTEWIETVESGWNILYKNYRGKHNPSPDEPIAYGDGKAAERIIAILEALC